MLSYARFILSVSYRTCGTESLQVLIFAMFLRSAKESWAKNIPDFFSRNTLLPSEEEEIPCSRKTTIITRIMQSYYVRMLFISGAVASLLEQSQS